MNKTIRAIYQGGVFHPLEEGDLKDKSEVLVTVESSPVKGTGSHINRRWFDRPDKLGELQKAADGLKIKAASR